MVCLVPKYVHVTGDGLRGDLGDFVPWILVYFTLFPVLGEPESPNFCDNLDILILKVSLMKTPFTPKSY
jgi:hypothetical protein